METGRGVLATAVAAPADLCFAANQHTDIRREQKKAEKLIKDAAKRQDIASARASSSGRLQRAGTTAGRHHSWPAPLCTQIAAHSRLPAFTLTRFWPRSMCTCGARLPSWP